MHINSEEHTIAQKRAAPDEGSNKNDFSTTMISEPGKKCSKKKKSEILDDVEVMTEQLHELLENPVLVMGLFDIFFEKSPEDLSINYKGLNIQIQTNLNHDAEGIDLLKYLGNKFI